MALPGLFNPMFVGGKPAGKFTYRTKVNTDGSGYFIVPATVQAGDLLVFFEVYTQGGYSRPAGFTSIRDTAALSFKGCLSYKRADGSEAGVKLRGGTRDDSSGDEGGMLVVFAGPFSTFTPGGDFAHNGSSGMSEKTIPAGAQAAPLVAMAFYFGSSTISTRSFTPAADAELTLSSSLYIKYKIFNTSPQDVVVDSGDNGTNIDMGCYILGNG